MALHTMVIEFRKVSLDFGDGICERLCPWFVNFLWPINSINNVSVQVMRRYRLAKQLLLNITRSTGYCRCNGDYSYVYNHNQNQQDKQEKLQGQQKRLQVMLMQGKVVLLWTTFFAMT